MKLTREVDQFLSEKRALKNEKKRKRHWEAEQRHKSSEEQTARTFGSRSKIIEMLADCYDPELLDKYTNYKGGLELNIPKTLSIIEDPESAVASIGLFARVLWEQRIRNIFMNHSALVTYDLAAMALIDVVAMEAN